MKENRKIRVMAQAFYGNNTITDIDVEKIDRFIMGRLSDIVPVMGDIDRTIINIPNTDGIVIIYNKYQENDKAERGMMVTAKFPEENLELHSRCIACRIDESGNLTDLNPDDVDIVKKYFVA